MTAKATGDSDPHAAATTADSPPTSRGSASLLLQIDVGLALRHWKDVVVTLPGLARREDRAERLRELSVWYERVYTDHECVDQPPLGGLDALVDELTGATQEHAFRHLALARWAVRVAEELVHVRALGSTAPLAVARDAVRRLELACATAARHFEPEREGGRSFTAHYPTG